MKNIFYFSLLLFCYQSVFAQSKLEIGDYLTEAVKQEKLLNYRKSADICLQGIKESPSDMDLYQQLGKSYLNLQKLDSARFYLYQVASKDHENVAVRLYLINIESQTKRYSSAICYVNELLETTPYDKKLWLQKITFYSLTNNTVEASRAIKRLLQIFPNDAEVQKQYSYITSLQATNIIKNKNPAKAREFLNNSLLNSPQDKNTLLSLISVELQAGRWNTALEYTEQGLGYFPDDFDFIKKKIGILEQLKRYDTAIDFLKVNKTKINSQFYTQTETYLTHQAAVFYENTDPYILHQKSYALDNNQDSYNFLLSNSIDKGFYDESLRLLNDGLRRNPNDKNLLVKQMIVYQRQNNVRLYKKSLRNLASKYPNDSDIVLEFGSLLQSEASGFVTSEQYDLALADYTLLMQYPEFKQKAQAKILEIYLLQNRTSEAQKLVDQLLAKAPNEPTNLLHKAEVLKATNNSNEALLIIDDLVDRYPNEQKYKNQYVYYTELYAKELMAKEQYNDIVPITNKALEYDSNNKLLYGYAINAAYGAKNYDKMLELSQKALAVYPDDIDFNLKQIEAYNQLQNQTEATDLLQKLLLKNPNNTIVKNSLSDQLYAMGTKNENEQHYNQATDYYRSMLNLDANNLQAYRKLVNLYILQNDTQNAMLYANEALAIKPNADEAFFNYKKGVIYEMMRDYKNALYYQKLSQKPKEIDLADHLDYLANHPLKNTIGVGYQRVKSEEANFDYSVATLYYLRKLDKNAYGFTFNYGARTAGVGTQIQGEWSHVFSKSIYIETNAFVGSKFFPKTKFNTTLYKSFKNDSEISLGAGYMKLQDQQQYINIIPGYSKTIADFWIQMKVNVLSSESELYSNFMLQSRYSINERGDYFSVIASAGNAPQDDSTFNFDINTFTTYTNSLVGVGYKWNSKHKYSFSINTDMLTYKISDTQSVNQFQMVFAIQTKF
jgi:YaiO family outer membrane protein